MPNAKKQSRQSRAVEHVRQRINHWTNVILGSESDNTDSNPEVKLSIAQRELADLQRKGFGR